MSFGNSFAKEKLEPIPEIDLVTWVPEQKLNEYEMANYIAEEWKKLGLRVKVNPLNFPNPFIKTWMVDHKFDAAIIEYRSNPARMEPDFFTNSKFNSVHSVPKDWNCGEYKNPEFDRIGEEQLRIYDSEKRRKLIYRLQEILYEDQPETVISYAVDTHAVNTTKFDIDYVPAPEGILSVWNYAKIYPKGADKVIKIGTSQDPEAWNPLAGVSSNATRQLRLIYDRVVQLGPDGSVRMWAATNVKGIDDTTVEVELRKDMKFHDGVPVTAKDVKFSYEYIKKWKAPYFVKYLKAVERIELIDDYKLRFHLSRPYAPFVMNTLGQVYILPMHIWKDLPEKAGLSKPQDYRNVPAIGSGMYTLEYWKEGQEFMLRRNANHFTAPKVDLLNIILRSDEVQVSALKKGTIDMSLQEVSPAIAKEYQKEKGVRLFKAVGYGFTSIHYHCGKPPFNDTKLRVALAWAIPYKKIIDEILWGDGGVSASTICPANGFWHNQNLKPRHYDLKKARALLKEAGYRWDGEGRLCYPPK